MPLTPEPPCSGKVTIVGHTLQETGEALDQGFLKCIDMSCHGEGRLTALGVNSEHRGVLAGRPGGKASQAQEDRTRRACWILRIVSPLKRKR